MNRRSVVAATHNPDKLAELSRILAARQIDVLPPPDPSILEAVEETGETFAENALIKARAVFAATGLPTIADDSGLCVAALGGEPGVRSARWLGEHTPQSEKNAALLAALEQMPDAPRLARFECAVALVTASAERVFKGACYGAVGPEARGQNGFGYDPVFWVGERSFAELSKEEKDAVSHRGRALARLCAEIDRILEENK